MPKNKTQPRVIVSRGAGLLSMALVALHSVATASVIGTNPPAQSITRERIASLPARERGAWVSYLAHSERQRKADKEALQAELRRAGLKVPIEPPHGRSARSIPLDREAAWYAGADARHIADVIVSYQTPAGGWGKNLDMSKEARKLGEAFTPDNLSRFPLPGDFDAPLEPDWNYVGTIDNDATTTQLNFLAKVISAVGPAQATVYQPAFLKGMDYLFAAQFPNGGWPQVWPLQGGYHDAITFNDDAMTQVVDLMRNASNGQAEFAFVPVRIRTRAEASFERGIRCILATQIVVDGRSTVWPQQDDALTLKPVSARNYEPPAQCASESASLLLLLMNDLPHPTIEQQNAIRASAAVWLKKTAIYGQIWEPTAGGRKLVVKPGAGPIWARYYVTGTDTPVFGDRDKTLHDNVNELSMERRNGYAWYGAEEQRALEHFDRWAVEHPEAK